MASGQIKVSDIRWAARKISMINLNNCSHTVLISIELIRIVNLKKIIRDVEDK